MSHSVKTDLHGQCGCGATSYHLLDSPMFTHCCHCTSCQRETGSGFAINALIETSKIQLEHGELETRELPSNSGSGQTIIGCRSCKTVLWSHYSSARETIAFVRAGTLANAGRITPDIHIFLQSKLPWVQVPSDHVGVTKYYRQADHWPAESIARYKETIDKSPQKSALVWS